MKPESCPRHPNGSPCTCAMGNVYRFVEPVLLYMLREKGGTHGYQLASCLQEHTLTDAEIEGAAMYRTLRRLEEHGYVKSTWDIQSRGPARRLYSLTKNGRRHLEDWAKVLDNLSQSMGSFVSKIRSEPAPTRSKSGNKRGRSTGDYERKTVAK